MENHTREIKAKSDFEKDKIARFLSLSQASQAIAQPSHSGPATLSAYHPNSSLFSHQGASSASSVTDVTGGIGGIGNSSLPSTHDETAEISTSIRTESTDDDFSGKFGTGVEQASEAMKLSDLKSSFSVSDSSRVGAGVGIPGSGGGMNVDRVLQQNTSRMERLTAQVNIYIYLSLCLS